MEKAVKKHGAFSWNELMTSDITSAKTFYSKLLGWEYEEIISPEMTYYIAKMGDQQIGGLMASPKEAKGVPSMWGSYITVDDVDKSTKKAESLGGKLLIPPRNIPNVGRFSVMQDVQGATFTLITYSDTCQ